jgi:hypothetical protein
MWKKKLGIPSLVAMGLILTTGVTYANLKATNVVRSWDEAVLKYQNSNVVVNFDGHWHPFLHELAFDTDPYKDVGDPDWWPDPCPGYPLSTTQWAGIMEYGLYHEDNAPDGAPGWQETRDWQIVNCDRNEDGKFDKNDLELQPPDAVTPVVSAYLEVITQDQVVACTTGNCKTEIVTTLFINTDLNCDGTQDITETAPCFYAEARTPLVTDTAWLWSGPLQARIGTAETAGDKTVSFNPLDAPPTAVVLASFTARRIASSSLGVSLWVVTALLGIAAVGVVTWRMCCTQR